MIVRSMQVITARFLAAGLAGIMLFGGAERTLAQSSDSAAFHEGQMFPVMIFPSLAGSCRE